MKPFSPRKRWEMAGWIAFTLGSLLYLADSIRLQNLIGGVASFIFLAGCVFFIISETKGQE